MPLYQFHDGGFPGFCEFWGWGRLLDSTRQFHHLSPYLRALDYQQVVMPGAVFATAADLARYGATKETETDAEVSACCRPSLFSVAFGH